LPPVRRHEISRCDPGRADFGDLGSTKLGLEGFSAAELTVLRFVIASLPALLVPRPRIAWPRLVAIGMTLFCGQFLLLFFAFGEGMPAGLASVTQQSQAFFTVVLAAAFLREVPGLRQYCGMAVAFAGLALIGLTVGGDLKLLALGLALAGAFSWAVGNVLVKRTAEVPVPLFGGLGEPRSATACPASLSRL
jgi:O-acetylserine/cysteine efflux transporter